MSTPSSPRDNETYGTAEHETCGIDEDKHVWPETCDAIDHPGHWRKVRYI